MINRINVRIFLGIFFCVLFLGLRGQHAPLSQADSLFINQKYTEAFDIYEEIYLRDRYTSSMLLKMAFIQDGLGNYAEAIYYLDKYYNTSADREVVGKIGELVEANGLKGFSYDDTNYFSAILNINRPYILFSLTAISVLLLVYIFKKSRSEESAVSAGVIQMVVLLLMLGVNNISPARRGIIISDNTLLKAGPSAGAEPVEILPKGHKLKVLDRDEVWTKAQWDGQEVYIRNGKLRII